MALDRLSAKILTSLHGRRLGLDVLGFQIGTPGTRHPYETATAASTLADSGVSLLVSTEAVNFTLQDPREAGIEKTIINNSTFANTVTRSTVASIYGATGTSPLGVKMSFLLPGAAVTLIAASTSRWVRKDSDWGASTAFCTVSTSS